MRAKEELPECPVATAVSLIGGKWKLLILVTTINQLLNRIKDVSIWKARTIPVDISLILGNLITVIFDYQILRKPLKILSL